MALAGALLVASSAAMAGVVVKSSGPSAGDYPVGKKIDDEATITLKAGDSVTVLTSKGTRVMSGAGTYKVGDRPKATRARFAALTRKRAANRVRTGAVRGAAPATSGEQPMNPNLWYVDVSRSGPMCLYDLSAVRLWRPFSEGIATYRVVDTNTQSAIDITFDDGEAIAALDPARMTIAQGTPYTIAGPEGTDVSSVTFVPLSEDYPEADQLAEALVAQGCLAQVDLLAERLGG
ncbi:MAG: hypothetical protein V2I27_10310 [Erythrobacter sp.]|nr:hypothetical protein [Erythrobacter sp.]